MPGQHNILDKNAHRHNLTMSNRRTQSVSIISGQRKTNRKVIFQDQKNLRKFNNYIDS